MSRSSGTTGGGAGGVARSRDGGLGLSGHRRPGLGSGGGAARWARPGPRRGVRGRERCPGPGGGGVWRAGLEAGPRAGGGAVCGVPGSGAAVPEGRRAPGGGPGRVEGGTERLLGPLPARGSVCGTGGGCSERVEGRRAGWQRREKPFYKRPGQSVAGCFHRVILESQVGRHLGDHLLHPFSVKARSRQDRRFPGELIPVFCPWWGCGGSRREVVCQDGTFFHQDFVLCCESFSRFSGSKAVPRRSCSSAWLFYSFV